MEASNITTKIKKRGDAFLVQTMYVKSWLKIVGLLSTQAYTYLSYCVGNSKEVLGC